MTKKRGLTIIIAMLLATVLCIFTSAKGWGPTGTGAARNIRTGLDLSGGVSITYEADETPSAEDMDDTVYKLQKRVEQYSTEANVYKEGASRINVEIPGVTDANAILAELGTPGSLYFIAETDKDGNANYAPDSATGEYKLNKTIKELEESGSIVCTGSDIDDAQGVITQDSTTKNNKAVVELSFTKEGTTKFADATTKAYANGESIGIYYDEQFVSVPTVNAAITDGKAIIEGMSDIDEAKSLASFIRIGGLKVTLHEIRSNVVGAQLGHEAIRTSLIGGAAGLCIVCLIMIFAYLLPGVIASAALILYVALMLIMLNAFDLTLTLPGIAGIILGIGMAVDANVVIYSRIQEEIQSVSARTAVENGFHKAMSAIVDGNITTLIAAAVLGYFGTGTIKGFAMTLALSVALSMFTALVISRYLCKAALAVGFTNEKYWARKKKTTNFDFVKMSGKFIVVAAIVLAVGIGSMVFHSANGKKALNFSLEFLGGTSTTASFPKDYTLAELDSEVKPVIAEVTSDSNISMQKVVGSSDIIIKTRTLSVEERENLEEKLTELGVKEDSIVTESISATVGKEMRKSAILSVILAVILMLLYIFVRFADIRFASAAVLALCHDILIVLMVYAVLRISVGNAFIAVMLTILGYSINSTIVIFDRIREMKFRKESLKTIVNDAINATLSRSVLTNLTTFASILVLYILGVASIKEFTLPMMAGILAGACSSVFLTGPLWLRMHRKEKEEKAVETAQVEKKSKNPNVIRKKK